MEKNIPRKETFNGFPFYIFISILLGGVAVFGISDIWKSGSAFLTILCALLFICHIGLYWFNIKEFQSAYWWGFYYMTQTALIIVLATLPYGTNRGISILVSASISMIGEALGLWGNTRRSLSLGLFYLGMLLVSLYFLTERDELANLIFNLFINGGFTVLFMVVLNQQLAERQKAVELAETLESANAKLAAYAAKIESLTLQNERQRMARELHDTLAQGVAGLVLQLEAVKAHLAANRTERASAIVEQSLVRARGTLAESRAAIDDLRAIPENLSESAREKIERFKQATGIPCELEVSLQENNFSNEITAHAIGILGEALANVTRHAQAKHVHIKFIVQNDQLVLEIHDDGRGFDMNDATNAGHYGLLGMRERARLSGGRLTIESKTNSGTNVHFSVPSQEGGGLR